MDGADQLIAFGNRHDEFRLPALFLKNFLNSKELIMSLGELKEKLDKYNVPIHWYSLDGELKPDCLILYQNYAKREIFYMDERGGRTECAVLYNDSDAYDYLWKLLEQSLKLYGKH